jgi:DivIVA domain-containing protein
MALTPEDIEKHQFSTSRRGFDQDEVRRFLRDVAEAQRQAAESPRFGRIGDEVAAVLESAHRSAAAIEEAAQAEADRVRASADASEAEIAELRSVTERQVADDLAKAESTRNEADVFAKAETERIEALKAQTEQELADKRKAADDEQAQRQNEAEERASTTVNEAEAKASQIVTDAEARAREEIERAEQEAQLRATTVIANAQERLDKLLAAERDVHDRLVSASTDLRAAIERVAGRHEPAERPARTDTAEVEDEIIDLRETTPAPPAAPPVASAEDADELGKMVREGVGNALKDLRF